MFLPFDTDRSLFVSQAKDCIMAYSFDEYEKRSDKYFAPPPIAELTGTQTRSNDDNGDASTSISDPPPTLEKYSFKICIRELNPLNFKGLIT